MEAPDPVETFSDIKLAQYIARLRESRGSGAHMIAISSSYVAKRYTEDQLEDVMLAMAKAEELNVRVPRVKRVAKGARYSECIQDRIHGPTLLDAWTGLGWVSTLRLAFHVRRMVRRMRTATSPTAGSLGTGLCRSFWLEDRYGIPARSSPSVIFSIINFLLNLVSFRREAGKTREEHVASCEGPTNPEEGWGGGSLVFTHHDLAPRNMILADATRTLWMVDWDEAGWYPKYFEHAGMHNFTIPEHWGRLDRLRWNVFSWLATGSYKKESRMLAEIQRKATRFPAARRFNIMAGASPSARPADD